MKFLIFLKTLPWLLLFFFFLPGFFEDLATESQIDADKPVVIKNMVHARKTLTRKANTLKFEKRRRSCSKFLIDI